MSKAKTAIKCPVCDGGDLPVRDCLGSCGKCGERVESIDYLHLVGGYKLCDGCAGVAGHFASEASE
jgi:hypothetical protein